MGLDTTDTLEVEVDEDDKDGGVDVIVWHGLGDANPAFPVFLIQCTVQSRWEKKPCDVVPERWSAWIRFGKEPTIGLAIPQAVPDDAKVRAQTKYTTGVLLERIRLCQLMEGRDISGLVEYAFMETWTLDEITLIVDQLTTLPAAGPGKRKKQRPRLARTRRPVKSAAEEVTGKRDRDVSAVPDPPPQNS